MKQTPAIRLVDEAPPAADQPAYGVLRERVLDAYTLGLSVELPRQAAPGLQAWAEAEMAMVSGAPRGLDPKGLPEAYLPVMRWAGVPLAHGGELRWLEHMRIEEGMPRPEEEDGVLLLPEPAALSGMSSLAIKPLRLFVAQRLGLRLQIGTGVGMFLWSNRALLTNSAALPLSGFLHGPGEGRRHNLSLMPGGWQSVELDEA